ncbi:putative nuclease HARBI1 [Nasonia vitripennis]|uniref:DDE Tnp4 domain-containing protein n=1 Tax=Nasonia vitripennis TaxID=7425 RepID=A0A7M7TDR7_NASVI|nr:putative nuclease HARBI1 [Nasonia vitripennis]
MAEIDAFLLDIFNAEQEERVQRLNRFHQLRLERQQLRDVSNPFTLPAEFFRRYYRMPPHVVMRLIGFLAEGGLQKGFAQDFVHPVSQSTASQCIARVIDTINHLADDFIRFPGTEGQREHNSNRFQRTTRIPGIIGAVDGFMVTFYRPTINEEAFFNYRVGTSMNVQIIVDSDYNILNIRVCPGSNNDRFVWQFSEAKEYMEDLRADENFPNRYYIIGDSGYTPSRVLLTPDLNAAEGSPAHVYTLEHVRTRCIVERTIGILTNVCLQSFVMMLIGEEEEKQQNMQQELQKETILLHSILCRL